MALYFHWDLPMFISNYMSTADFTLMQLNFHLASLTLHRTEHLQCHFPI